MEKAKRKYTVSDKSRAANRRNLILARAVDARIRFRPTPKRLRASRANLTRALAALHAASLAPDGYPRKEKMRYLKSEFAESIARNRYFSDSPAYGTNYRRGLCVVSLRRSARLAGEAPGAFDVHLELFAKALGPRSERERRLARGIAEAVWRRLRVFKGQARWESARLLGLLQEAARGPLGGVALGDTPSVPRLAAGLGFGIDRIFTADSNLNAAVEKLDARLERLARLWVVGRGGDPRLFDLRAPVRVTDSGLLERRPESMGNPFVGTIKVAVRLEPHAPVEVHAFTPNQWTVAGHKPSAPPAFWVDPDNPALPANLMRDCQPGCPEDGVVHPSENSPLESIEGLQTFWDAAWERIAQCGYMRRSVKVYGYTLPEMSLPPIPSKAYDEREGRACLQAIWSRLRVYTSVSKYEAEDLHRILSTQIEGKTLAALQARLGRIPGGTDLQPCPGGDGAAFLMELMLMFDRSAHAPFEQMTALPPLSAALHTFVMKRFGASENFKMLDPIYADAAANAWENSRRNILGTRLAKYEEDAPRRSLTSETAAQAVARAEARLHDVEEMDYLENCESSREMDAWLLQPEDPFLTAIRRVSPSPDWMARYRAAASCKMVSLQGWKYESRAQCWARVGVTKKKVKG